MRWLLFLSRLALVCNIFFLLAFSLHFYNWALHDDITSTIIIIGYFLSILFNPLTNIAYLVVLMSGRKLVVAGWLVAVNIVFLILQLVYIILLNPVTVPSA